MGKPADPTLEAELKGATAADIQAALWATARGLAEFTKRLRSARLDRLSREALARMHKATAELSALTDDPLPDGAAWAEFEARRRKWEAINKRFDTASADLDRLHAESMKE